MKRKEFDCVEMKHAIQREILEEMRGLSPAEVREWTERRIRADPILGPIWRAAASRSPGQDARP